MKPKAYLVKNMSILRQPLHFCTARDLAAAAAQGGGNDVRSSWEVRGRFFVLWVVLLIAHTKSERNGHRDAACIDLAELSTTTPSHHEQNLPF